MRVSFEEGVAKRLGVRGPHEAIRPLVRGFELGAPQVAPKGHAVAESGRTDESMQLALEAVVHRFPDDRQLPRAVEPGEGPQQPVDVLCPVEVPDEEKLARRSSSQSSYLLRAAVIHEMDTA